MTTEQKDPLFGTKSVSINPSGTKSMENATRLTLRITPETAKELVATLQGLTGSERGVSLDIHYGTKRARDTGAPFNSAFFFAKEIQERPAVGGTFQRKEPSGPTATEKAAAEIKRLG